MNGDAGCRAGPAGQARRRPGYTEPSRAAPRAGRAGGIGWRAKNETEYVYRVRAVRLALSSTDPSVTLTARPSEPHNHKTTSTEDPCTSCCFKVLVAFAGDTLFE